MSETPEAATPRPRGRLLALGVLVATFVVLAGGLLDRMRAHARRVFVVNGTALAVRVTIADQTADVPPGESRVIHLPEGTHTAQVASPDGSAPARTQEVPVVSDLLSRHLAREVFVLNVDGAAALVREEARPGGGGGTSLLFGRVLRARGIDFAFEPFPDQLHGDRQVRLGIAPGPPAQILAAAGPKRLAAALSWAEGKLDVAALDEALLATYARRAGAADAARAVTFLTPGLDHRPLSIPWHRAYQTARLKQVPRSEVEAEYAARLRQQPGDSALLYLLGRVSGDAASAQRRYQEAIDADPENAYAWFGSAVRHFRRAELEPALERVQRAVELRPRDGELARLLLQVRFARGELAPVRETLAAWLKRRPTDLALQRELLEALSAADDLPAAREAHQRYRTLLAERPSDPQQRALLSELALLYLQGKYAEQLERAAALSDVRYRARVELEALIELDRLNEAEQRLAAAADPDAELALALAWQLKGKPDPAAGHREAAQKLLAKGSRGDRAAAALLTDGGRPTVEALRDLAVPPARKALLLLLLHPKTGRALAQRYNYGRLFPRDFLARAIAHLGG